MARVLQVDLKDVKTVALIGIIHGLAEVIERSTVILIDYLYRKIATSYLAKLSYSTLRKARNRHRYNEYAV